VAAGVATGAGAAALLARPLQQFLYRVEAWDPVVCAIAIAVVVLTVLLATLWPARRAAATDPAITLRAE
jgi:ABC-type lipoprotein release transport system permease subunit